MNEVYAGRIASDFGLDLIDANSEYFRNPEGWEEYYDYDPRDPTTGPADPSNAEVDPPWWPIDPSERPFGGPYDEPQSFDFPIDLPAIILTDSAFYDPPISPLIIDLDGDGVETVSLENSQAYFDLDSDGFAELTGWVASDDALLALDRNGNGVIDNISELFGNETTDGFTELAALDSNQDGVIDAADAEFANLRLWQDANGDGITDVGELVSLTDAGLVSIDLNAEEISETNEGNPVTHRSTVLWGDNSTSDVDDVWFNNSQALTRYVVPEDFEVDEAALLEALKLPALPGYGVVPTTIIKVLEDNGFKQSLIDLMIDAETLTPSALLARVELLVEAWVGVDDVVAGSRGAFVDAKHLAVLEAFHGQGFRQNSTRPDPGPVAGAALEAQYNDLIEIMAARFVMQVPASRYAYSDGGFDMSDSKFLQFARLSYDLDADRIRINTEALFEALSGTWESQSANDPTLLEQAEIFGWFAHDYGLSPSELETLIRDALGDAGITSRVHDVFVDAALQASATQFGTDGDDVMVGTSANDQFFGALGDDRLEGGQGDDTYVYARGAGHDTIDESSVRGGTEDTLVLRGIDAASVSFSRDGDDVILTFAESAPGADDGGSVRLAGGLDNIYDRGLERVVFDDGTVWIHADVRAQFFADAATSGDDTIVGFDTDDTIEGGAGDDTLSGENGDDTYVYVRGDGHDTIDESNIRGGKADTLALRGIAVASVSFSRDGDDVILTVAESAPGAGDGGSVRLSDGLGNLYDRGIERVVFDDGTVWTHADIRAHYFADAATSGDDSIVGFDTDDTIEGSLGDDTLTGEDGDDTYVYTRGDGHDTIDESNIRGGKSDTLVLRQIDVASVSFSRDGDDVILNFAESAPGAGDGGSVRLKDSLHDYHDTGIENVAFDDGTVWTRADMRAHYFADAATSGDDTIVGFNTDDMITGGLGDDTFVFRTGDGVDTITDFVAGQGSDDVVAFQSITGVENFADVMALAREVDGDTWIELNRYDTIVLSNVAVNSLHADDFQFV
ncbi:MAG: calcium-binding protein [Methyloceanibacter sp.]|nr:calcium-binding protein [Methyloceanibacter sp.]